MRRIAIVSFAVLVAVNVALTQDTLTKRTAEASVSVLKRHGGGYDFRLTNRRYVTVWGSDKPDMVVQETTTRKDERGRECCESSVQLVAFEVGNDGVLTERWKFQHDGDEGKVDEPHGFYRLTNFGCCGDYDYQWYFDLDTGKEVYSSTAGMLVVTAANVHPYMRRYVTWTEDIAPDGAVSGVIRYGDRKQVKWRLRVESTGADVRWGKLSWEYEGKTGDAEMTIHHPVAGAKPESFTGFKLRLKFQAGGHEVVIPVEGDHPVIGNALVPTGLRLTRNFRQ